MSDKVIQSDVVEATYKNINAVAHRQFSARQWRYEIKSGNFMIYQSLFESEHDWRAREILSEIAKTFDTCLSAVSDIEYKSINKSAQAGSSQAGSNQGELSL